METMKTRILDLCKKTGISARELERRLDIPQGYISKVDKHKPTAARLKQLADYFNVSTDYLLNGELDESRDRYYLNEETASIAQSIFRSKELSLLFHTAVDSTPDDIALVHNMLLALKRKENK